jgi:predicted DNA-binding transcriptional regulator AlpA
MIMITDKSTRLNVQPESTTDQEVRTTQEVVQPRLLRLRDAPRYLGMDKNRFNREVRPRVTVIPIGSQGVAFDRLELDSWVDEYKRRNGRPPAHLQRSRAMGITQNSRTLRAAPDLTYQQNLQRSAHSSRALQRAMSPPDCPRCAPKLRGKRRRDPRSGMGHSDDQPLRIRQPGS